MSYLRNAYLYTIVQNSFLAFHIFSFFFCNVYQNSSYFYSRSSFIFQQSTGNTYKQNLSIYFPLVRLFLPAFAYLFRNFLRKVFSRYAYNIQLPDNSRQVSKYNVAISAILTTERYEYKQVLLVYCDRSLDTYESLFIFEFNRYKLHTQVHSYQGIGYRFVQAFRFGKAA